MVMTRNKVEDHSHCAKKRRWLSFQLWKIVWFTSRIVRIHHFRNEPSAYLAILGPIIKLICKSYLAWKRSWFLLNTVQILFSMLALAGAKDVRESVSISIVRIETWTRLRYLLKSLNMPLGGLLTQKNRIASNDERGYFW
jgi:hypothetical protein